MKTLAFTLILGLLSTTLPAATDQCQSGISVDIEGAPQGFKVYQKGQMTWSESSGEFFSSDPEVREFCSKVKLFPKKPERIVVLSSTYLPWLSDLSMLDQVIGVTSKSYVANEQVHQQIAAGKITEVGLPASAERVLGLRPDLILTYKPIDREIEGIEQLSSLGLNVLELSEFKESGPLSRASWLLFLAATIGDQADFELAKKVWSERFQNYQDFKKAASSLKKTPVIIGNIAENAWAAPLPMSDLSELVSDAGGSYLWSKGIGENLKGHALSLSFEKVLQSSSGAKVWLTQNQWSSLEEAYREDARYRLLVSTHKMNVFNYNKDKKAGRGFDYWESGVARPDLLLRDLILIFHSDDKKIQNLFKNKDTKWYQKLD